MLEPWAGISERLRR